jgi:nicotinamidase-related amidase
MSEPKSKQSEQLNQNKVALLVIDVQKGLFEKSTPIYKSEELLQNITWLIDRAHGNGVPVFYIQHSDSRVLVKGTPEWQLHSLLRPLSVDQIIHKQHGNAFEKTILGESLQSRNITTLVITGLVTHGCVRATCIGAMQLGYKVILAKDAHSSYSKQAASLIDEWNQKLSEEKVELKSTSEIGFIQRVSNP